MELRKKIVYLIVGHEKRIERFRKLTKRLSLYQQVHFLAGRDDIPQLLWSADVLLHVSRRENTGTAIVEAMVAGLPVITTANCGYAPYVSESQSGIVIPEPFVLENLTEALKQALQKESLYMMASNASNFAQCHDFHGLIDRAVKEILA